MWYIVLRRCMGGELGRDDNVVGELGTRPRKVDKAVVIVE